MPIIRPSPFAAGGASALPKIGDREVALVGPVSLLGVVAGVVIVIASYLAIIAAQRGSLREIAWTALPAVALLLLLIYTAQATNVGSAIGLGR